MKKIVGIAIGMILTGSTAWAGTGAGRVSCFSEDGNVVALYSWFHSNADSWANLVVFNQEAAGQYTQYNANGDQALAPLSIKNKDGVVITVTPDLRKGTCTISASK